MHTYIPSFLNFLPIQVTTTLSRAPCAIELVLIVTYFIHSSVSVSIPNSQCIPLYPLWNQYICSLHLCLYFCFGNKIIYTFFLNSTCISQYMIFLFFLSDLLHSMIVSRFIHISANDMILFIFMAEEYSIVSMCYIFGLPWYLV